MPASNRGSRESPQTAQRRKQNCIAWDVQIAIRRWEIPSRTEWMFTFNRNSNELAGWAPRTATHDWIAVWMGRWRWWHRLEITSERRKKARIGSKGFFIGSSSTSLSISLRVNTFVSRPAFFIDKIAQKTTKEKRASSWRNFTWRFNYCWSMLRDFGEAQFYCTISPLKFKHLHTQEEIFLPLYGPAARSQWSWCRQNEQEKTNR